MSENIEAEVYEDNAGAINAYAYRGGECIWSGHYYGDEEVYCAACDFIGVACKGLDPEREGWESAGLDPEREMGELIACTRWYRGRDEELFDVDRMGYAGHAFYGYCDVH